MKYRDIVVERYAETITKFIEYHFRTAPITKDSIKSVIKEAGEKIKGENHIIQIKETKPPRRIYRKRIRWDERNRRRRKKRLPEKENPYWSIFYYNIVITHVPTKVTITLTENAQ